MTGFYRGSTPTLTFTVVDGPTMSSTVKPVVSITQEGQVLSFENDVVDEDDQPLPDRLVIDNTNHTVSVTLTEAETMSFGEGMETKAQLAIYKYVDGEEPEVIRYPVHELVVMQAIIDFVIPQEELPDDDEEVIEDPDQQTEDPEGPIEVDLDDYSDYYTPDYEEYYGDTYDGGSSDEPYTVDEVEPMDYEDEEE